MSITQVRHVDRRDRRVIAEGARQHVSFGIVAAVFHQRAADAVRCSSVNLSFDNERVDGPAAIVHASVREDLRLKCFAVHFKHGGVQLRGIGQCEIAVFAFDVGNFERSLVDVPAVERDVFEGLRQLRVVEVNEIRQSPVVDRFVRIFDGYLRPLRADSKFQLLFLGLQGEGG